MTMRPTTAGAARWIERNPRALPALQRAHGIQQRMYGHALPASGPRACAHEALVPGREHSSGRASTLEPRPDHTRGARGTAPEHVGVGGRARGFRRRSRHPRCLLFRRTRPSTGAHASLRRLSPSMESKSKPKRMLVTVRGDCSWQIKKEKKRCTGKTPPAAGEGSADGRG